MWLFFASQDWLDICPEGFVQIFPLTWDSLSPTLLTPLKTRVPHSGTAVVRQGLTLIASSLCLLCLLEGFSLLTFEWRANHFDLMIFCFIITHKALLVRLECTPTKLSPTQPIYVIENFLESGACLLLFFYAILPNKVMDLFSIPSTNVHEHIRAAGTGGEEDRPSPWP